MDGSNNTSASNYTTINMTSSDVFVTATSFINSFLIIGINSLLIFIYCWKKRHLLSLPSNWILLSLWICNLCSGLSVVLISINYLFHELDHPTSNVFGVLYRIFVDIFSTFLVETLVMHLCGITLDRYISIFHALRYQSFVTARSVRRCIAVSWLVPLIASSIQWAWLHKVVTHREQEEDAVSDIEIWYSVASFAIFLALPLSLLAAAYILMFLEIQRIVRFTPRHHQASRASINTKQRRVIYVFSLMYITFVILAMPYFTLRLLIDIHFWKYGKDFDVSPLTVIFTYLLNQIAPSIIAGLYAFTTPEVRSVLKEIRDKVFKYLSPRGFCFGSDLMTIRENDPVVEYLTENTSV